MVRPSHQNNNNAAARAQGTQALQIASHRAITSAAALLLPRNQFIKPLKLFPTSYALTMCRLLDNLKFITAFN